ncbi:MAG TPA: hypothetical protein VHR36_16395 [Pyrinomonadaceae bacterium]|nr:hypothetical protein [Pyrinomonadaceae bacterium]
MAKLLATFLFAKRLFDWRLFARSDNLIAGACDTPGNHRRQAQRGRLELGLGLSRRFQRGKQSSLLTLIATMVSVSLCARMKS